MQNEYLVLDTNILLLDSTNLYTLSNSGSKVIVIPDTVIQELDSKKTLMEEIGFHARRTSGMLSDARLVSVDRQEDRTTIHAKYDTGEFEVTLMLVSKKEYKDEKNDLKIIEIAEDIHNSSIDVTFISNDTNCRFLALTRGIKVDFVREQEDINIEPLVYLTVDPEVFQELELKEVISINPTHTQENYAYHITSTDGNQSVFLVNNGKLESIDEDEVRKQEASPRNLEQLVYSAAILSQNYDFIICDALAGSGKSFAAISSAMKLVRAKKYSGIYYLRNTVHNLERNEEVGFLPGPQPLTAKILTPTGWVVMGDIAVGDLVITNTGEYSTVKHVTPQGTKKVYRVTTTDGGVTECSEDHLWETTRDKVTKLRSTAEIMSTITKWGALRHKLPKNLPVEFDYSEPLVDPYLLGLLIGDGSLSGSHVRLALGNSDSEEIINNIASTLKDIGCAINRSSDKNVLYTISGINGRGHTNKLKEALTTLGLQYKKAETKFIPESYKVATLNIRVELLRGLIDSDGSIRPSGEIIFYTSSSVLASDVKDLVHSIGGIARISTRDRIGLTEILGIQCNCNHIQYIVQIDSPHFNLAKLQRKATNYKAARIGRPRMIKSVEYVRDDEVQCITLDNQDGLYLTDDYIVTHNSDEKFAPFFAPLYDTLRIMVRKHLSNKKMKAEDLELAVEEKLEELMKSYNIKPITTLGLRGRTLTDSIIIMDEAQNFSPSSAQTALTRIGEGCMVIAIGSSRQIDNAYLNKYTTSLAVLLGALKKEYPNVKLFGAKLTKVVRGRLTEFAENIFSKGHK